MRSFLTRLALVGIVGVALAGCGTSNGTALSGGALPGGSGGGPINTTPGVGGPPGGTVAPVLIDNGITGTYSGFNTVAVNGSSNVDSQTDPTTPGLPPPPAEPDGVVTGSHNVSITGNSNTQVIVKYSGSANLTYQFGFPGNGALFTYGSIITHFWLGEPAQGSVAVTGTATAGDWVSIAVNGVGSTYNVVAGDTTAKIANGLVNAINGDAAVNSLVYAQMSAGVPSTVVLTWRTTGVGGNAITLSTSKSPGATEILTSSGPTLTGGVAAGTLGAPTSWSLELVGNGTNAGPGTAANTYDVRVACTSTPAVFTAGVLTPPGQTFRFSCGPLPAYGSSNTVPALNPVFPAAAGAFTPINPAIYVVLNYAAPTAVANTTGIGIDNIYAIQ